MYIIIIPLYLTCSTRTVLQTLHLPLASLLFVTISYPDVIFKFTYSTVSRALLTGYSISMANEINCFVDNMQLNSSNSLTHLLNTDDNEELNVIRHSPYISDDQLLQYRSNKQNGLSIFSVTTSQLFI